MTYAVLNREGGELPDGTPFILVDDEIGGAGGGRSEMSFAFKGNTGVGAVAETYASEWPQFSTEFGAILHSLRFTR